MSRRRVIPFACDDKLLSESWGDADHRGDDIGNFPAPFRMLLLGPPNSGKSTLIKNLIVCARPPYDEVYVVHEDAMATREYDDVEPDGLFDELPGLDFWDSLASTDEETGRPLKRLIVVDDLEYTSAHRQRKKDLAVLLRYASSHKGLSVMISHQSFFDLPALAKKMASIFVIWKPNGRNELGLIENRVGLPPGALTEMFRACARDPRDSITVDTTRGSPARLRLNIWEPIEHVP